MWEDNVKVRRDLGIIDADGLDRKVLGCGGPDWKGSLGHGEVQAVPG